MNRPAQASGQDEPTSISSSDQDDWALVDAVLRKDRKATAEFVSRYTDDLFRYVRSRLIPNYDQVEDIVQETFLAAWESLSNYEGKSSLQAWVMGIARHKVEDHYRQRLRLLEPIDDLDLDHIPEAGIPEFHSVLEQAELQKNTRRVLAELPEHYRMALIWRYWDKTSARDMALKTGKTEKAIERLLARARTEFRTRWNRGQSS